jgi:hypothetical protein
VEWDDASTAQRQLGLSANTNDAEPRGLKKNATAGLLMRSRRVGLRWAKRHKKARAKKGLRYRNFIRISFHGIWDVIAQETQPNDAEEAKQ